MYLEKIGKREVSFISCRAKAAGGLACPPNSYLPSLPSIVAGCHDGHMRAAE